MLHVCAAVLALAEAHGFGLARLEETRLARLVADVGRASLLHVGFLATFPWATARALTFHRHLHAIVCGACGPRGALPLGGDARVALLLEWCHGVVLAVAVGLVACWTGRRACAHSLGARAFA